MEIGIGDLRRGLRMIRLARRYHAASEIRYIGVDLFEAGPRSETAAVSLKQAYRMLRATGARVHLIPGDAVQSLVRSANALPGNELVLVSAERVVERLGEAWHYIPRMLSPAAMLYAAEANGAKTVWRKLPPSTLPSLAPAASHRRAA
ncbi:MAG TPA: hypothetical protein VHX65_15415 [Pirellulales bacterium]|nr:hypothetical protein [Pirellulales bacterium]